MTIFDSKIFSDNKLPEGLNAPIEKHLEWAIKNIYSKPYPNNPGIDGIARYHHGAQHVTRTAIYIPILANLYRKHGDPDALALLDARKIKLLQIAAIFHDSGREAEGVDKWDTDSAFNLFCYLRATLKIPAEEAIEFFDAVANKDYSPAGKYFKLIGNPSGWVVHTTTTHHKKSLYANLLHDADCLDVKRRRFDFDGRRLDFYQKIPLTPDPAAALDDIARIIKEVGSLIDSQGDNVRKQYSNIKKNYIDSSAYSNTRSDIHRGFISGTKKLLRPLMSAFLADETLLPIEKLKTITFSEEPEEKEDAVQSAFRRNFLFARGIRTPSAIAYKSPEKLARIKENDIRRQETLAQIEIRKITREKTKETASGSLNKQGNPNRSASRLGWGAMTYCSSGFLVIVDIAKNIKIVSPGNIASGQGKKKSLTYSSKNPEEELNNLLLNTKLVETPLISTSGYVSTHNEIILDIPSKETVAGVFFSRDSNITNFRIASDDGYPLHQNIPVLEAIYLQNEYALKTGIILPIYQYSGTHNFLEKRAYSDDDIVKLWKDIFEDSELDSIKTLSIDEITQEKIKELKIDSMISQMHYDDTFVPPDSNYPDTLKESVDREIKNILIKKILLNCVETDNPEKLIELFQRVTEEERIKFINQTTQQRPLLSRVKSKNILLLLLQGGANLHHEDENGDTAFHWCIVDCKIEAAEIFLDYLRETKQSVPSVVNRFNNAGYTPLGELLTRKREKNLVLKIVTLLLDNGASLLQRGKSNLEVLSEYEKREDVQAEGGEIVALLKARLRGCKEQTAQSCLAEKMLYLEEKEQSQCLPPLIQAFKIINGQADTLVTIFHPTLQKTMPISFLQAAALLDNLILVQAIFSCFGKEVCLNLKDLKYTSSPLMFAAEGGAMRVMAYLIEAGANINEDNEFGNTALYYAVKNEQLDAVKFLLSKGAIANDAEDLREFKQKNQIVQKPLEPQRLFSSSLPPAKILSDTTPTVDSVLLNYGL